MHLPKNKKEWRALVNMVMKNQVPENVRNFLNSYIYSFTKIILLHKIS